VCFDVQPIPSSAADTGPWRRQAGQIPPGPPQQQPIRAAPMDETGPIRRGQPLPPAPTPYGREPPPPSVADQTDNWRKKTELPPAQSQRAPSPERAPSNPSNQPWRPARDRQGAAPPPVASMTNERYISGPPPQSMRSGGPEGGYSPGDQGGPWRQSARGPGAEQPIMQRRDFSGPGGGPPPMRQQQRHDEDEGNWRQQQRVPPPPANSPYGAVGPMRTGPMGGRDDRGAPPPENMMRRPMGEKPPPSTGAPPPSGQADQDKNWRKRAQQQQQ